MVLVLRCSLCGEILECPKSDKKKLLNHIQKKHPEIVEDTKKCENYHVKEEDVDNSENKQRLKSSLNNGDSRRSSEKSKSGLSSSLGSIRRDKNVIGDQSKVNGKDYDDQSDPSKKAHILYDRKLKKQPLPPTDSPTSKLESAERRRIRQYRTTIEKWRPGYSKIVCPNCGEKRTPIIKSKQNRMARSPLGAAFVLTCWPFCFLPYLFPPPTHEFLHCRVCNHFLGRYDLQADKVRAVTESEHQN